jgi:YegS/Rv2252/BmrU family lipid kinase
MEIIAATKFHRPFFILNPVAGTSDAEKIRSVFEKACSRFHWQSKIYETKEGDDLSRLVNRAIEDGCDVVMVSGGDGTVSEVASALVGKSLPLAIIPTGTGNLLARQLLLPLQLEKIFLYIADQPDSVFLTAMQIGERYYVLNASVGFSSTLIQNTTREDKQRLGMLAYFWTGLSVLIGFQPYRFNLLVDGSHYSIRASEVFISDQYLLKDVGLLKSLETQMEKGRLVVFAIKARAFWDYLLLIGDVVFGNSRHSHHIKVFQVENQIEIKTKRPLVMQADGGVIGKTPMVVKVIPEAVQVLMPNEKHKLKPLLPMD